jgi:predicted dehydrogenase
MQSRTEPYKVGIVGCGAVSQNYYAPALKNLERIGHLQVRGLFDPDQENRKTLAGIFPAARTYNEFAQEHSATCPLDLAILASPPRYHCDQSIKAMRAGMSVLCEKPMALSSDECQAMINTAHETGRVLAIGLIRRFFPAAQLIRQIVSLQVLGKIEFFRCVDGGLFSWQAKSASLFDRQTAGGGVLMDLGFHTLDLLMWWFGEPSEFHYQDDAMGGVETNCHLDLHYQNGLTGTVNLSRDWQPVSHYFIQCENGWLRWEVLDSGGIEIGFRGTKLTIRGRLSGDETCAGGFGSNSEVSDLSQLFAAQLSNVTKAMRGCEQIVASGDVALKTMKLIESCYKIRTLINMPWLSERELARARKLSLAESKC